MAVHVGHSGQTLVERALEFIAAEDDIFWTTR